MSLVVMARLAGLGLLLVLSGCSGDANVSLMQTCSAVDGRGNLYRATDPEMLDALERAIQQCEMSAADPATCTARGCGAAQ